LAVGLGVTLGPGAGAALDVGPGAALDDGLVAALDVGLAALDVGPGAALDVGLGAALDVGLAVGEAAKAVTWAGPNGVRARATEAMRAIESAGYATTALRRMRRVVTLFMWLTGSSLVWRVG